MRVLFSLLVLQVVGVTGGRELEGSCQLHVGRDRSTDNPLSHDAFARLAVLNYLCTTMQRGLSIRRGWPFCIDRF